MSRSESPETMANGSGDNELASVRSLLAEVRQGVHNVKDGVQSWNKRLTSTSELNYPQGISLLSLKNHLLLSYLHHLVVIFALKLQARSLTSKEGAQVVTALVKLRVVLEKIAPLEQRLKYQIEKLVRKADQADEPQDDEDVVNDPLAFRPNPESLMVDRHGSDDGERSDVDDVDAPKGGVYRPPRVSAMPYNEAPAKGKCLHDSHSKKVKKPTASHLVTDMSVGLSGATPYGETTTGLSVAVDPSLMSGTARHLKQIEEYEMSNFTRLRKSKKEAKKRRAQEEEVAFGGLGSGKNGRRRLGGFGAEFDDLLGEMDRGRNNSAYDEMKKMKKEKRPRDVTQDTAGTSGLSGLEGGAGQQRKKGKFDRAVGRMNKQKRS